MVRLDLTQSHGLQPKWLLSRAFLGLARRLSALPVVGQVVALTFRSSAPPRDRAQPDGKRPTLTRRAQVPVPTLALDARLAPGRHLARNDPLQRAAGTCLGRVTSGGREPLAEPTVGSTLHWLVAQPKSKNLPLSLEPLLLAASGAAKLSCLPFSLPFSTPTRSSKPLDAHRFAAHCRVLIKGLSLHCGFGP